VAAFFRTQCIIGRQRIVDLAFNNFITARRYASEVYAMVLCLSVRPSVRHKSVCSVKAAKHSITQTRPTVVVLHSGFSFMSVEWLKPHCQRVFKFCTQVGHIKC